MKKGIQIAVLMNGAVRVAMACVAVLEPLHCR